MPIEQRAAATFIWNAARLLDRHRYSLLFADRSQPSRCSTRCADTATPTGGFGHALEADLRCPASQPAPTLHALGVMNEAGAAGSEMARDARAWIVSIAEGDGGIPFVLPGFEDYPHAPWWSPQPGSFLTFELAALLHASGITDDEWLDRATDWCWGSIENDPNSQAGYWLKNACRFLDTVPDEQRARAAIASLAGGVDQSALAGADGEGLRALDLSPHPGSRSRDLISETLIEAHLDVVESGQQEDGGWMFDFLAWSPAQTTEWRGAVTIEALTCLRDHGRL